MLGVAVVVGSLMWQWWGQSLLFGCVLSGKWTPLTPCSSYRVHLEYVWQGKVLNMVVVREVQGYRSCHLTALTNSHHRHQYDQPQTALTAHTDDDTNVTNEGSCVDSRDDMADVPCWVTMCRHRCVRSAK